MEDHFRGIADTARPFIQDGEKAVVNGKRDRRRTRTDRFTPAASSSQSDEKAGFARARLRFRLVDGRRPGIPRREDREVDARRYECIKALISGALALPIEQRLEYLRREGGGDDELIREAIDLLAHDCGHDAEPADSSSDSESLHSLVGQTIAGYQLIRVIGAGGMGVVFLAEQTQPLTRRVALKVIKIGMDTREVVARFDSERRALAMMNHPNIARVLDAGATESGRPYFAMEYIAGAPIIHFCQEQELDLEARIRLFIQVCRGIHHAHQRGIIHRDIKPSNIIVSRKGEVKLMDFGIARDENLGDLTRPGTSLGTPAYMSPEQIMGVKIDFRSDIFSFGVVLYQVLTGTKPFTEGGGKSIMHKILNAEFTRPRKLNPNIPHPTVPHVPFAGPARNP